MSPDEVAQSPGVALVSPDAMGQAESMSASQVAAPSVAVAAVESSDEDEPFPLDALPAIPASMVSAMVRAYGVPAALPAIVALGVASRAILGLSVRGITNLPTPGNLYLMVGAPPKKGKSTTYLPVAEPLRALQRQIRVVLDPEGGSAQPAGVAVATPPAPHPLGFRPGPDFRWLDVGGPPEETVVEPAPPPLARLTLEGAADRWLRSTDRSRPRPAHWPCLLTEDITPLALMRLLRENGEFLGILSSDGRDVLNRLRSASNLPGLTCLGLLLKCFSGDPTVSHRVDRSVELEHPLVTLLLLTQPNVLHDIIEDRQIAEQGLLSRCLVAEVGGDSAAPSDADGQMDEAALSEWTNLVYHLGASYMNRRDQQCELDAEAVAVLKQFRGLTQERREGRDRDVGDLIVRAPELATRVSLVLHAMRHGPDSHAEQVNAQTASNAVRIVDWFLRQMLLLKSRSRTEAREARKRKILMLLERRPDQSARELRIAHVANTSAEVIQAMEELIAEGRVTRREIMPPSGGRTKVVFRLTD